MGRISEAAMLFYVYLPTKQVSSDIQNITCSPWDLFSCHFPYTVVVLLFYVHGKHLRSCRDGPLT